MFTKPTLVPSPKVVLPSKTEGYPKPSGNEGVPKQTFGSQNFVQTFGLQALQSKALYGGKTTRRRRQNSVLQALQSKALYGGKTTFCKPYKAYKAKLCTSFVSFVQALQIFGYQSKPLDRKPKGTKANLWIAKLLDKESTPLI